MTGISDMDSICVSAIVVERVAVLPEVVDNVSRRHFLAVNNS
jgi:hypothetical protein